MAPFLLAACAAPGTAPGGPKPEPTAAVAVSLPPAVDVLPCTKAEIGAGRSAKAAEVATPASDGPLVRPSNEYLDDDYRAEMLRRQMDANDAYLDRRQLPASAVPGAIRCALSAEDALETLHRTKVYDVTAVQEALAAKGLPDSTVRKPGSRDRAPGDGVVFAAWTGQACVVGHLSPTYGYRVEYGSTTADGGCLPAAD
ncbi:hypothetical protein [Paractinoplanes deccanensis]|uniref:hypothetical protein n=1 Tax=Paractinoplanes deccanensis TaxID=113561 RepID=UPI0019431AB8|nr:hypothetical protein [Actinoplanes deccanensis]